jgi:hypothetical protein
VHGALRSLCVCSVAQVSDDLHVSTLITAHMLLRLCPPLPAPQSISGDILSWCDGGSAIGLPSDSFVVQARYLWGLSYYYFMLASNLPRATVCSAAAATSTCHYRCSINVRTLGAGKLDSGYNYGFQVGSKLCATTAYPDWTSRSYYYAAWRQLSDAAFAGQQAPLSAIVPHQPRELPESAGGEAGAPPPPASALVPTDEPVEEAPPSSLPTVENDASGIVKQKQPKGSTRVQTARIILPFLPVTSPCAAAGGDPSRVGDSACQPWMNIEACDYDGEEEDAGADVHVRFTAETSCCRGLHSANCSSLC